MLDTLFPTAMHSAVNAPRCQCTQLPMYQAFNKFSCQCTQMSQVRPNASYQQRAQMSMHPEANVARCPEWDPLLPASNAIIVMINIFLFLDNNEETAPGCSSTVQ